MKISRLWPGLVMLGLVGCQFAGQAPVDQPALDECPKVWGDWSEQDIATQPIPLHEEGALRSTLSGPGALQNIPEFHDCQRFAMGETLHGPGDYSEGIFAIFAVADPTPAGRRFPDRSRVYEEAGDVGEALPAAQIFAEAGYEPLGISEGLNCVFLYKNGDRWGAAIRWDRRDDEGCHDPIPRNQVLENSVEYRPLSVTREEFDGVGEEAFPPVARWTWHMDQSMIEYRMGVPCDDGWCEISRLEPEAVPPSSSKALGVVYDDLDEDQRRVHKVKAWYDEQLLAVESGNSLVPSGLLGTIFPSPMLGRYDLEAFEGVWLKAADVALTPMENWYSGENPYRRKLNLSLTHDTEGNLNSVYLCYGEWEGDDDSPGCQEGGEPEPAPCDTPEQSDLLWWAKVESPDGSVEYRCVRRCGYSVQIPGTVRWSWKAHDEGIWMRCVNGCCEVGGDDNGDGFG